MKKYFQGLPYAAWPALDRTRWEAALEPPLSVLDDVSVASSWQPATRTTVRHGYGLALGWLKRQGLLDAEVSPEGRWPDEVVTAYAEDLATHLRPKSQHGYLLNLERALAVIDDGCDRSFLRRFTRAIKVGSRHAQKRVRLQDPAQLEELGDRLMALEREGAGQDRRRTGVILRDGLQIKLLARRPIRRRNFAMIEIGRHLIQDQNGGWKLEFAADETKNRTPLVVAIPADLTSDLEEYIQVYRPLLMCRAYDGPALWIARGGQPQAAHSIRCAIVKRTQEAFGQPVNPHLFRDCAATAIAIDDPENVRSTQHVLGHNNYASTQANYNLSKSIDASRTINGLFAELKRKGRKSRRSSRRRQRRDGEK